VAAGGHPLRRVLHRQVLVQRENLAHFFGVDFGSLHSDLIGAGNEGFARLHPKTGDW
jgi:hypothetical protein